MCDCSGLHAQSHLQPVMYHGVQPMPLKTYAVHHHNSLISTPGAYCFAATCKDRDESNAQQLQPFPMVVLYLLRTAAAAATAAAVVIVEEVDGVTTVDEEVCIPPTALVPAS